MNELQQRWPRRLTLPALVGLCLLAAFFRIPSHNWDQDTHQEPDEMLVVQVTLERIRFPAEWDLGQLLDPASSPLNTRQPFAMTGYGALFMYADRLTGVALDAMGGNGYFSGVDGTLQIGRVLSGLADVVTALLVFGVAALLWGELAGLVAGTLYATALLAIQQAHFYIAEPMQNTFMAGALLCAVLLAQRGGRRWAVLGGVCCGLAAAVKVGGATVVVLPLLVLLAQWWGHEAGRFSRRALGDLAGRAALVGAAMLGAWFIGDPYAILDPVNYLGAVGAEITTQHGFPDMLYTRKYVGTMPVVYPWWELATVGINPLAGALGTLGLGALLARLWRRRGLAEGLVLLYGLVYFAPLLTLETRWVRYLLPLVPWLCLCAVALLLLMVRWRREFAYGMAAVLVGSGLVGAVAFNATYGSENTRVRASNWIYANVTPGSKIAFEGADVVLPLPLPGGKGYSQLDAAILTDRVSNDNMAWLYSVLASNDYFVIASTRNIRTAQQMPWRYPVQIRFYDLLFSGKLGYRLVDEETAYPTIFGLCFPDAGAWTDVSWVEYDHSPVWIFKREESLSGSEWRAMFATAARTASVPSRYPP